MTDIKLGIALPATDRKGPDWLFADAFTCMEKPFDWAYLRPTFPQDYQAGIDDVRNELVRQAFLSDCTHVLMLDTDQTPEPDLIPRLFAHNLPIVSTRVHRRYPPYDPILKRKSALTGRYIDIPDAEWKDAGLIEVDGTGIAACGLFDISVFENIPFPWFKTVKDTKKIVGEDFYFCQQAQKAGYKIMVDVSLEVGHLTTMIVNKEFYFLYKKLLELAAK